MSSRSVNIDHEQMAAVVKAANQIGEATDGHFTNMDSALKEATEKENWGGESAENLAKNYEAIKNKLIQHIQELKDLGPGVDKVSNGYVEREEENTQQMRSNDSQERGI